LSTSRRVSLSASEYLSYRTRLSNWGRWGPDDELGTLNFITEDKRRRAARLVTAGRSVSLSRPVDTRARPSNPHPAQHMFPGSQSGGVADYLGMFIHGFSQTHIDALCHLATEDGRHFYNGGTLLPNREPEHATGTVDFWRDGIVTRGVLLDIPRLRNARYVEPGQPVHGWELESAAQAQGLTIEAGDAVCVRSGYAPYIAANGELPGLGSPAGLHATCLEYLFDSCAALLLWDLMDAPPEDQGLPAERPGAVIGHHLHLIAIPYMGLPLIDNCDLERLSARCEELNRFEFQLVVAPLVIEGGTGSPVNPLAIF
jgi:kynurenine formamidase